MMAVARPERSAYPAWNKRQYVLDSIARLRPSTAGATRTSRKDGKPLQCLYRRSARLHNYRLSYAALCRGIGLRPCSQVLAAAQGKENQHKPNAPLHRGGSLKKEIQGIPTGHARNSDRYRAMKANGATDAEIFSSFRKPVDMTVFTYHGDIDTVMTPLDSIRYYKSFLRAASDGRRQAM